MTQRYNQEPLLEISAEFSMSKFARQEDRNRALLDAIVSLRAQLTAATERAEKAEADAERLNEIAAEYYTLEPFAMPTPGGDDADVGWRVTQQHIGKPDPVEIAVVYTDDPRAAIDAARLQEQPK